MFLFRCSARLCVAIVITGIAITQENQPKSTCSISGQVVSAATGEPLRSARISLLEIDKKDPHTFRAVSDAEGRFALTNVAPGRYKFGARRGGYVPQSYKPPGGNPGALLELSAGTDLRDVLFRLSPAAVVVGRVTDENAEPASGVEVEALIEGKDDSLPGTLVVPINKAITNDLGEYRLYGLPPGEYFLAAIDTGMPELSEGNMRGGIGFSWERGDEPKTNHPPLYYPGVFDRSQSQKIKLRGGDETHADFSLRPAKTANVSGRVLTSDGKPATGAYVTLRAGSLETMFSTASNYAQTDAAGRFTIKGVMPGQFTLEAHLAQDNQDDSATQKLEVGTDDITNVELSLAKPIAISGRIIARDSPIPDVKNINVWLGPAHELLGDGFGMAEVKADGSFKVAGLREGTYRVNIGGLPEGWCLTAVSFGSDDVLQHGLQLERGAVSRSLQITIARAAARLEGTVLSDSTPVAGARVRLQPSKEETYRTDLAGAAVTDQNGRFIMKNIVPGEYKLAAVVSISDETFEDFPSDKNPDAVEAVTLGPSETKTVRIEVKREK